jgi:hypothetical protein
LFKKFDIKQEEIENYNRLCAEFLNLHRDEEVVIYNMLSYAYDCLKFHSDWNWIMEVVEAIEKLGYFVMINKWTSVYTGIEKEGERIQIVTVEGNSKIVNTTQAINQFLIWYNEKQQKNLMTNTKIF